MRRHAFEIWPVFQLPEDLEVLHLCMPEHASNSNLAEV